MVVHGLGLSKFVLHRSDNVLRDLALLHSLIQVLVLRLSPLRDERVQVSLPVHVWKRITCQCLGLYESETKNLTVRKTEVQMLKPRTPTSRQFFL